MSITPIHQKKISDEIMKQILANITDGEWKKGERLPGENEMRKLFDVSRISVRQAIHYLVGMGILEVRRGEGTFVREVVPADYFDNLRSMVVLDLPEYNEVQEFRLVFEPTVAQLAIHRATDGDLELMRQSVDRLGSLVDDKQAFALEDVNFHSIIAKSTRNPLIIKTNEIIAGIMSTAMYQAVRIVGLADGVRYHRRIYECIRDRRADDIAPLLQDHIVINIVDLP